MSTRSAFRRWPIVPDRASTRACAQENHVAPKKSGSPVFDGGGRSNGRDEMVGQGLTARAVAAQLVRIYNRCRGETSFACAG